MVSYGWLIAVAIISGCAGYFIAALMIVALDELTKATKGE